MNESLAWALHGARLQTFAVVADLAPDQMCLQSTIGEHHPAWTLGHLLLSDTYLLSLLGVRPLSETFSALLRSYGPGATPTPSIHDYAPKEELVDRLTRTNSARLEAVRRMTTADLLNQTPDPVLAQSQPTIGQHIQSLVFHEGYHVGKLSAWRKAHGLGPVPWAFAQPIA